jgi:hypothetical protein
MKALQGDYRIGDLCAAFGVSHRWRNAEAGARAREDALLCQQLHALHQDAALTDGRGSARRCSGPGGVIRPNGSGGSCA